MIRLRRALLAVAVVTAACAAPATPNDPVVQDVAGQTIGVVPLRPAPSTPPGRPSWTPWPSAQHDARHSGASATDGPTAGHVRWRRTLAGGITQGAVVGGDGTIYAASNAGILHALDAATGADRWTFDSGRPGGGDLSTSPLVLPDGTLLWGPGGDDLLAISPAGALLWIERFDGRPTSPVTADGRRVYVGDTGGGVTAIDVDDAGHSTAWTLSVGSSSYGSVVTDGTGRLYTTSGSALVAVDDRGVTGAVAWTADPHDEITEVSAGLGPDGTALLGTNGVAEWAYRRDGSPAWHFPRVITYSSPGVTDAGLAYVADHSGRVQVVTSATGEVRATYQLAPPQQIWTAVALDRADRLYFGTLNGHVVGAAADGTMLFDLDLGSSIYAYPALTGDGALVVGSRDGELVAIGA